MAPPARITVVENDPLCTLDLLAPAFAGFEVVTVRAHAGDPVPAAAGDALVVLGGYQHAYADEGFPWLPGLRALMAAAAAEGVPLLGVCLGAQLLAVACGGTVTLAHPGGREAGVIDVRWTPHAAADPLFGGLGAAPFAGPSMHADVVTALPPGAVLLGSSDRYANQAFRVGRAAYGVQFHPEASEATFARWAADAGAPEAVGQYRARAGEVAANAAAVGEGFAALVAAGR